MPQSVLFHILFRADGPDMHAKVLVGGIIHIDPRVQHFRFLCLTASDTVHAGVKGVLCAVHFSPAFGKIGNRGRYRFIHMVSRIGVILGNRLRRSRIVLPDRRFGFIVIGSDLPQRLRQLIGQILILLAVPAGKRPVIRLVQPGSGRHFLPRHIAVAGTFLQHYRQHFIFRAVIPCPAELGNDSLSYIFRHRKSPLLNSLVSASVPVVTIESKEETWRGGLFYKGVVPPPRFSVLKCMIYPFSAAGGFTEPRFQRPAR